MSFKFFIIITIIVGLNGCQSSSNKQEPIINTNSTDIPQIDEGIKVIKIPIISAEDLNE